MKVTKTYFSISAPDFVSSIEDENHVYFFFRESAVEFINCGKVRLGAHFTFALDLDQNR